MNVIDRMSTAKTDGRRDLTMNKERALFDYMDTFEGFDPEEIRTQAEVKRFMECYDGDRAFRAAADAGGRFTDEQRQMLKDIGITFAPEAMELLWKRPDLLAGIATSVTLNAAFEDLPADVHEALAPYPEMRIWQLWLFRRNRLTFVQKLIVSGQPTLNPEYDAWRARRLPATRNELGWFGWRLDHPCPAVAMAAGPGVRPGATSVDRGTATWCVTWRAAWSRCSAGPRRTECFTGAPSRTTTRTT